MKEIHTGKSLESVLSCHIVGFFSQSRLRKIACSQFVMNFWLNYFSSGHLELCTNKLFIKNVAEEIGLVGDVYRCCDSVCEGFIDVITDKLFRIASWWSEFEGKNSHEKHFK